MLRHRRIPEKPTKATPVNPPPAISSLKGSPHEAISSPLSKLLVPKLRCGRDLIYTIAQNPTPVASIAKRSTIIISIFHPPPCLCPRPRAPSPFPLSQAYGRHYPQSRLSVKTRNKGLKSKIPVSAAFLAVQDRKLSGKSTRKSPKIRFLHQADAPQGFTLDCIQRAG